MKISCNFECQLLACNVVISSKDDRRYYNATVFIPSSGEAGQLNIKEELYNKLVDRFGEVITFKGEYNDKYNSFYVVGIDE